jgi:mRNA-degrading endonuclease YafQ of YafQ-DinJ toxin-antitoxin module
MAVKTRHIEIKLLDAQGKVEDSSSEHACETHLAEYHDAHVEGILLLAYVSESVYTHAPCDTCTGKHKI